MAFPTSEFVDCTFTLVEAVSLARTASGKAVARVEYGDPYFTARFETAPLYRPERAAWLAWDASRRGGMVSFITHDLARSELLAYPAGVPEIIAETWNGEGTVATLAAETDARERLMRILAEMLVTRLYTIPDMSDEIRSDMAG